MLLEFCCLKFCFVSFYFISFYVVSFYFILLFINQFFHFFCIFLCLFHFVSSQKNCQFLFLYHFLIFKYFVRTYRLALNEHVLLECVQSILKESRLLELFYSPHAILRNNENVTELVSTYVLVLVHICVFFLFCCIWYFAPICICYK